MDMMWRESFMDQLWYATPAMEWNQALPLGNGFMGAMCFGGTIIDRFQLNNDSVWWGSFRDRINPDAKEHMSIVRKLIREGKIREAEELANETLAAVPEYQSHYEPLADVFFIPESDERIYFLGIRDHWSEQLNRNEQLSDYKRELNIEHGIHTVSYTKNGISFCRESFISYPDRVMAVKCEGTPLRVIMERESYCDRIYKLSEHTLCMEGQTGANGVKYCLVIRVISGNSYIKGRTLHCDGNAEIILASQTSFYCDNYIEDAVDMLDKAEKLGYEELKNRHMKDVSSLMNRCVLAI